jgi:peptidyl-prolyl cis-trans isomerase B (cyclophilin B)
VAGKQERQRRLARERHERRAAREAERQRRTRQITQWVSGGLVVLVLAGVVAFTISQLNKNTAAAASSSHSPSTSPSAPPSASPSPSPTPTGPVTSCTYIPSPPAARKVGTPPAKPDFKASYQATIKTNRGSIVVSLLNSKAPCTVNSFVYLASKNYFNSTPCPRLVTTGIYVLQCGDPTGTGRGGPGYRFADENLAGATYPAATVAMANSGAPETNGSQFFLVYKNTPLPPQYTPFGTVVSGLSVLQSIAKAGVVPPMNPAGGGHPKEKVTIESVTIKKT